VRELAVLDAALTTALQGRGQMVLLGGEAGIGKTRLSEKLIERAGAATVCWGRCWEGEGAPAFWPWVQVVRQYLRGRDAPELRADLGLAAADVARMVPEIGALLDVTATRDSASASGREQERFRFFDGLTGFLKAAARRRPLVLALDDLQWADTPSLLLLQFLARDLTDGAVLVLATYRDGGIAPDHPLSATLAALARERICQRLTLGGLDRPEIERFVELVTRRRPPARLISALNERTEGNPLFLSEVVRLLAAAGQLDAADDPSGWRRALPTELQQTITRRIAPLPAACRHRLEIGAVIGREFDLALLHGVASGAATPPDAADREHLHAELQPALDAGLVVEAGRGGHYAFAHALIRETVYAMLSATARERLHRSVAEVIERVHADQLEAHLAALASHWAQGEAGPDGQGKAFVYARWAGDQSLAGFAYEDAVRSYEHALAVLAAQPRADARLECELWLTLADARMRASDVAGERVACERAAALARALDDPELLGRAALGFGWTFSHLGADPVRIGLLEDSLRRLPAADSALRARLTARLGQALFWRRDSWPRPHELSAAAVAMARRVGEPATLAYVLNARLFCLWSNGALPEQLATASELVAVADAAGERELGLQGRNWLITMLVESGDIAAVEREMLVQERIAADLRLPLYFWFAATWRAMLAALAGDFDAAERLAEAALAIGEVAEPENAVPCYSGLLYILRRERGQLGPIADMLREQSEVAENSEPHRSGMAFIYAETGHFDESRREMSTLTPVSEWHNAPGRTTSTMALAEACTLVGDAGRAAELYDVLLPDAERNVSIGMAIACQGSASRVLGRLATTLRRFGDAEHHFADALAMHERMRARPLIARTQHDWAEMLLARDAAGDRAHALTLLGHALGVARELGMESLRDRIEALHAAARASLPAAAGPALETPPRDPVGSASPETSPPSSSLDAEAIFRREGDYWTIAFQGTVARLKDSKGLQYIAWLLRHPGQRFPVADVALAAAPETAAARRAGRSLGPLVDGKARDAYRRRLADLRGEVDEAERMHDHGRAERAREELERIEGELGAALGLGGRSRSAGGTDERARWAVTKRIKAAIERVRAVHPSLGRHLATAIATGSICAYQPEPERQIRWQL
jgi:eukaryotic-like serine/threonine-protein kinase